MVEAEVLERFEGLEGRLRAVELELGLRVHAAAAPPSPAPPDPPQAARPAARPAPPPARALPPRAAARARKPIDLDLADLVGPRALAWAGGVVTLLGVVFLFVLAVDNGWIGPVERVGLGAVASLLLLGAGIVARTRYGNLHAAVSAAGAGIGGGYATLLAAAALYELVPAPAALALAAGIAAAGTALALAWSSQTVASIGLLGAMAVPLAVALDGHLSVLGTAFAAVVFAAAALVGVRKDWSALLAAAGALSLLQIVALLAQEGEGAPGRVVVLAAGFWLLYLATGLGARLANAPHSRPLAPTFVLASAAFAVSAAAYVLVGELVGISAQGAAMLAVAVVTALAGGAVVRRDRDFAALLWAVALAVGALAGADLLSGTTLAAVWAAEAAVLAWLAARVRDTRFAVAAVGYLVLAAGHVLVVDAPARDLFERVTEPASGAPAALSVAVAALLLGLLARRWPARPPGVADGALQVFLGDFATGRWLWSEGALVLSGVAAVYALSLELVAVVEPFTRAHVAVTGLWAAAALAVLAAGLRAGSLDTRLVGHAALAVAAGKVLAFDVTLGERSFGVGLLLVAAAALAAALLEQHERREGFGWLAPGLALASAALVALGVLAVTVDPRAFGYGLLAAGVLFGALAAGYLGRRDGRDLATALWVAGLALALGASTQLLADTELVLVWAAACAAFALLANRLGEPRFQVAALTLGVLAVGETVAELAPPSELFSVNDGPATGVVALLASALAVLAVGALARVARTRPDALDELLLAARPVCRPWAIAGAAVLVLYAASLAVLGASVEIGSADLTAQFQRGHTVVSALWGLVGLVALTVGLRRGRRALRRGGIVLFVVALGKLFVYDLAALSPMARAFSFLAVGGVLLLAGFFYQRLGERNVRPAAS